MSASSCAIPRLTNAVRCVSHPFAFEGSADGLAQAETPTLRRAPVREDFALNAIGLHGGDNLQIEHASAGDG